MCFCFKRRFRLKEAELPSEIRELFGNYSENGLMSIDHLHRFFKEVQGDDKHLNIFHRRSLYLKEFFRFLMSDVNGPLPSPPKVHHDMTSPLSHYFIHTGHNSYLTGNQISSDSSEVPIVDALNRGVRVIELDMWPNSGKDDVDIMHGGTLTSPVKLIRCLNAIREHAFAVSEYPVIITLEDHLTQDLQAKVAEMVSETFEDAFVISTSDSLQEFPSPESLKRRVIISTKAPKEYLETKVGKKDEDDGSAKVYKSTEELAWGKEISDLALKINVDHGEFLDEEDHQDENHGAEQNAPSEYKRLIAIRAEKMKGGIKPWLRVCSQKAHRVSLNEEKLEKAVVTNGTEIVR